MSKLLTDEQVQEIRDRHTAATPGPWQWFGNTDVRDIYLATKDRGRQYVMRFFRWGMQGAAPAFQRDHFMINAGEMARYEVCPTAESRSDERVYRADLRGIKHPDAELIAHAPTDIAALLADRDALLAEVERLRAGEDHSPREPQAWPNAGQWIATWNECSAEDRLLRAQIVVSALADASHCYEAHR